MKKPIDSKFIRIVVILASSFIFQILTDRIGWKIALLFDYSMIDRDNIFMAVTVHHIIISALALLMMFILHRYKKIDFGIKPMYDRVSVKMSVVCCFCYLIYYIVWYTVVGFLLNAISGYNYELNTENVIGTLEFQLLISGTADELIFRAIPAALLV